MTTYDLTTWTETQYGAWSTEFLKRFPTGDVRFIKNANYGYTVVVGDTGIAQILRQSRHLWRIKVYGFHFKILHVPGLSASNMTVELGFGSFGKAKERMLAILRTVPKLDP